MLEKVCGVLSSLGGIPQWRQERGRGGRSSKDCNSHFPSPCTTESEEVEKLGVTLSSRKRER